MPNGIASEQEILINAVATAKRNGFIALDNLPAAERALLLVNACASQALLLLRKDHGIRCFAGFMPFGTDPARVPDKILELLQQTADPARLVCSSETASPGRLFRSLREVSSLGAVQVFADNIHISWQQRNTDEWLFSLAERISSVLHLHRSTLLDQHMGIDIVQFGGFHAAPEIASIVKPVGAASPHVHRRGKTIGFIV